MWYRFSDTIHGIHCLANSYLMAWSLIRNECHLRGIRVPLLAEIERGNPLTEHEAKSLGLSK